MPWTCKSCGGETELGYNVCRTCNAPRPGSEPDGQIPSVDFHRPRGPSERTGIVVSAVLTIAYWAWESQAGGNIRVDLPLIYLLLFGSYLYVLQRLGWLSALITLALMFANFCFFVVSYELFDKPLG